MKNVMVAESSAPTAANRVTVSDRDGSSSPRRTLRRRYAQARIPTNPAAWLIVKAPAAPGGSATFVGDRTVWISQRMIVLATSSAARFARPAIGAAGATGLSFDRPRPSATQPSANRTSPRVATQNRSVFSPELSRPATKALVGDPSSSPSATTTAPRRIHGVAVSASGLRIRTNAGSRIRAKFGRNAETNDVGYSGEKPMPGSTTPGTRPP